MTKYNRKKAMAVSNSDNDIEQGSDLYSYSPSYLVWIANELSRSASQHYRAMFNVGIEVWRILVMLNNRGFVSAQKVCEVMKMDKASVSRSLKNMRALKLIEIHPDTKDRRIQIAALTPAGQALHDSMQGIARERERIFLQVLTKSERQTFLGMLHRLHANLPEVDRGTTAYIDRTLKSPESAPRTKPNSNRASMDRRVRRQMI